MKTTKTLGQRSDLLLLDIMPTMEDYERHFYLDAYIDSLVEAEHILFNTSYREARVKINQFRSIIAKEWKRLAKGDDNSNFNKLFN